MRDHWEVVDVAEHLRRSAGSATFAQLRASVSGRAIRTALAAGVIRRIAKGVYALPPPSNAIAAARAQGGVVSHQSAAVLHGLDVLELPLTTHVTVPRGQHLRRSALECELHWADQVEIRGDLTTEVQTVLDCARTLPFAEGLCVADSALRKGLLQRDQLLAGAAVLRGPGSRRARRIMEAADGRAESPLESALRALLIEAKVGGFVPQVVVRDDTFSARIDLAHPTLMIALEADSFAHHGTRSALTRDCRRHANLTIRGWRLIRFSWEEVMFDPEWVVAIVRCAVEGRTARPSMDAPSAIARRAVPG